MFKKMLLIFIPILIAPGCRLEVSESKRELMGRLQASSDIGLSSAQAASVLNGDVDDLLHTSFDGASLTALIKLDFQHGPELKISMSNWLRLQELSAKAKFSNDITHKELNELRHLLDVYIKGLPAAETEGGQ